MNPFDMPPSSPPVEPTTAAPSPEPAPRRGRMIVAVFATAGVIGAAAFGVSQFASAEDDPQLVAPASTTVAPDDEPADEPAGGDEPTDDSPDTSPDGREGELRIEVDEGEPIIVDLDELDSQEVEQLHECLGMPNFPPPGFPFDDERFERQFEEFFEGFDAEQFEQRLEDMLGDLESGDVPFDVDELQRQLEEMLGDVESDGLPPRFDRFLEDFDSEELQRQMEEMLEGFDPGDLRRQFDRSIGGRGGPFGDVFSRGGQVTIIGPDGVTVVDLGDGDGEVTISRDGETGEITVTTEGTASTTDLGEVESCLADLD